MHQVNRVAFGVAFDGDLLTSKWRDCALSIGHSRIAAQAVFRVCPIWRGLETEETVLMLAEGLYDAQEWATGEPPSPAVSEGPMPNVVVALSSARIASLATAVACLHSSAMRFSPELASFANSLSAHLAVLREATITCQDALPERVRLGAEGRERRVALRWLDALPQLIEAASVAYDTFVQELADGYTLNHGDLWPAHTYFEGDTFAGFTDFESLCFASPAFDLAQVVLCTSVPGMSVRMCCVATKE